MGAGVSWVSVVVDLRDPAPRPPIQRLPDYFEFFGPRQVYEHWKQRNLATPKLREPLFYASVRYPM